MSTTAIKVTELSKRYRIGAKQDGYTTLRESISTAVHVPLSRLSAALHHEKKPLQDLTFWALKGVSFDIEAGDAVGIVGSNGAGKSTLLKILSRIVEPTVGEAQIHGRVGSLLEVGTGFHPELTGRENIFLNGVILGMKKSEIVRKFDEIVAFAGVEQFIDTPVKRYSSGMYVRLAFAVAAHLETEILLVDEVLAVGDTAFQKKCLGTMGNIAKQGRTVLFISHNMAAMTALCKRCLLMDGGALKRIGPPAVVIEEYMAKCRESVGQMLSERTDRSGNGRVRFTRTAVLNHRLEPVDFVTSGQNIALCLEYHIADGRPVEDAYIQISFSGTAGQPLFGCLSRVVSGERFTLKPAGRVICHIPTLPLASGIYTYSLRCKVGLVPGTLEDFVLQAGEMIVCEGDFFGIGQLQPREDGDFLVAHHWSVDNIPDHSPETPPARTETVASQYVPSR